MMQHLDHNGARPLSGSGVDTALRCIVIENTLVIRLPRHQLTTSATEGFTLCQTFCPTSHRVSDVVRVGKETVGTHETTNTCQDDDAMTNRIETAFIFTGLTRGRLEPCAQHGHQRD